MNEVLFTISFQNCFSGRNLETKVGIIIHWVVWSTKRLGGGGGLKLFSSFDGSSQLLRAGRKKLPTFLLWQRLRRSGLAAAPPLFTHLCRQLHPRVGVRASAARPVTHQPAAPPGCQPACLLCLRSHAAHVTTSQGLAWHLLWRPSSFSSQRAVNSLLK